MMPSPIAPVGEPPPDRARPDIEAPALPTIPDLPGKAEALVVSYLAVRRAVGGVGLLLPVLLGPVGVWVFGIPLQENMSSYYHTGLRDVFVGSLCTIGIFLFCYKGYDRVEDWTANFGCLSALGLAFCPLDPGSDPLVQRSFTGYLHSISGGIFFFTLAFYSLYHFPHRPDPDAAPHEPLRRAIYRTSGVVILLSMAAMGAYLFLLPPEAKRAANRIHFLFWGEWVAVWAFAAAWLTKGRAIFANIAIDLMALPAQMLQRQRQGSGGDHAAIATGGRGR